jgi:hypothetical protein
VSSGYTGPVTEIFTDLSGSQCGGGASLQAAGAWPPDRCRGPAGASAARRHTLGPAQHPLPILPASPPFPPGFNVRVRVTVLACTCRGIPVLCTSWSCFSSDFFSVSGHFHSFFSSLLKCCTFLDSLVSLESLFHSSTLSSLWF